MTEEDDRRSDEPGRRLTDNQIIAWQKEGSAAHAEIECDIASNSRVIAEVKDDVTLIRSELSDFREDACRQFTGIGDCINDLKAWQHNYDRQKQLEQQHRGEREIKHDSLQKEIEKEFEFRRRLGKWRNSALLTLGTIIGAVLGALGIFSTLRDLFSHPHP
jgi:hypothetical protein